jgi:hypothetical protein
VSDGIGIAQPFVLLEFAAAPWQYGKICLDPSFCYRPYFGCYSRVRRDSAGQVSGGKVARKDEHTYIDTLFSSGT